MLKHVSTNARKKQKGTSTDRVIFISVATK